MSTSTGLKVLIGPVWPGSSIRLIPAQFNSPAVGSWIHLMAKLLDPFRFLMISLAGWMNQHHVHAIDDLREENRDWGYRRIQGALSNLGHEIARTIASILQRHGIELAPGRNRKPTWKEFLSH